MVILNLTKKQAQDLLSIYEQEGSDQEIIEALKKAIKQAG